MTRVEHIEYHKRLHKELDILIADWISHTTGLPSRNTVHDLMSWSYQQTLEPSEDTNAQ